MTAFLIVLGRAMLGIYFLQAGVRNFMKLETHTGILASKKVPQPRLSLLVALTAQVLGGLSLILGIFPAVGAVLLIGFTIIANALYHDFWNYQGAERVHHLNFVMANVGQVGGLLLVLALSL